MQSCPGEITACWLGPPYHCLLSAPLLSLPAEVFPTVHTFYMWHFIHENCTVQHCSALYSTLLQTTVFARNIWLYTVHNIKVCTAPCTVFCPCSSVRTPSSTRAEQCSIALKGSAVQCSAVQSSAVKCIAVQCSAVQCLSYLYLSYLHYSSCSPTVPQEPSRWRHGDTWCSTTARYWGARQ